MQLRWLNKEVFAGFVSGPDGEEYNEYREEQVLQFRETESQDWADVPVTPKETQNVQGD